MGVWDFLKNIFKGQAFRPPAIYDTQELARRLGTTLDELLKISPAYHRFPIPKRSGGTRQIAAPADDLKQLQRTILHRLFGKLKAHSACTAFERNKSIVTNAACHVGSEVVLRMDIKDFFTSTSAKRIKTFFQYLGWDNDSTDLLVKWCTLEGGLPQGAPTSPRLSNLVNYRLDCRLNALARKIGARYSRYADDITFSFPSLIADDLKKCSASKPNSRPNVAMAILVTKKILAEYGYRLHIGRKLSIRRKHQCQKVTGLVVNQRIALPRETRRWLRAVRHHQAQNRPATLTPAQLAGWTSFEHMVQNPTTSSSSGSL